MMLNVTTKDEQPCRCFSMSELISATDNFDEKWCIGHGGFGKVYTGKVCDGPNNICAIKRLHFESQQGATEFWVEVKMLSRLRHRNIVPLIGFCKEGKEMALVYEYMHNGTLYDHLHKKGTALTWSQRLEICIGAAHGLEYLHAGSVSGTGIGIQQGVIHRDVKSTNILLAHNYSAKIADFGLAKIGPINQTCTYVSTKVKGSFGYIDPSYFYTGRLTRKSDVYAFGVVLLEVLCGRPALDVSLDEGLAIWAQDRIKRGKVDQIIDSRLGDHISRRSLKEFSSIAVRCLFTRRNQRPTMTEVVGSLYRALSFQERKASSPQGGIALKNLWSFLSLKGHFELISSGTAESKEKDCKAAITESVSLPLPAVLTEVEPDQRELVEGQDDNQPKPNLVSTSYIIPPTDMSLSASKLRAIETFAGFTEIKESIRISNRDNGYSDYNSRNGSGGSRVELGNKYMFRHLPSQEGESNVLNTRNPTSNSGDNAHDHVEAERKEVYQPGVFVILLALRDGTNKLKRIHFSRKRFDEHQAETWWSENRGKVYERYNVRDLVAVS